MMDPYLIDFPLRTMRNMAGSISHRIHFAYMSPGQSSLHYFCVADRPTGFLFGGLDGITPVDFAETSMRSVFARSQKDFSH